MNHVSSRRSKIPRLAWAALVLLIGMLALIPSTWPRWLFMWLLAFAIYSACKVISWSVATPNSKVPKWRHWAYFVAWPGLDAAQFLVPSRQATPPTAREWIAGAAKMVFGVFIFWTAQRWLPPDTPLLLTWAGMIGFALILHFGLFHLLSCFWRAAGVDAPPLMIDPLRSTSVTEFWSKRWNTAFRDFTHQFIFAPLARRFGRNAALVTSFFFSGLIHDIVISLPAGGGYGKPTLFFLIQPAAILMEKSRTGRRIGLGRGWRGWVFTAIALLAPARLLFHDPFVVEVVVPFMRFLGAA